MEGLVGRGSGIGGRDIDLVVTSRSVVVSFADGSGERNIGVRL